MQTSGEIDPWELGPAEGESLRNFLERCVTMTWRGADEPVSTILGTDAATIAAGLLIKYCPCGKAFRFRPGALKATCPGCGARYEIQGK